MQGPARLRKGGGKVTWGQNHSRRSLKPLFHLQVTKAKSLLGPPFPRRQSTPRSNVNKEKKTDHFSVATRYAIMAAVRDAR